MPLIVLGAGFHNSVQDCGRFGFRNYGVPAGGALDSASLRILNLVVGNEEDAAGIEATNGRLRLRFTDDRLFAWSGGDFDVTIAERAVPKRHCARATAGDLCEILPRRGRAWLAISGGIDVPKVLGSRSTDLRARYGGLKGRALRDRDEIPLAESSARARRIAEQIAGTVADWSGPQLIPLSPGVFWSAPATSIEPEKVISKIARPDSSSWVKLTLRIVPGKNWSDVVGEKFLATKFRVAMNSDRMGLRLEGTSTVSGDNFELVSEPIAPGTIQLPPGGDPIVLLADCQTVGGYPKLAHVITVDLALAAQLQPRDELRFELTSLEHARDLLRQREHEIAIFRAGLQARFG